MNNWLVWSLLSALFAGATAVLAKIGVADVDSNFATAIRTTVILLFTWMIASFTRSYWSFGTISFRTWLFLGLWVWRRVSPGSAIFGPCNSEKHHASRRWTN